jgi:hypothetical protein
VTIKSQALVVLSLLFTLTPVAALAGKPVSYCLGCQKTIEIVDCGDFSVMDDAWVKEDVKDFYDKDGNLIRSSTHLSASDMFYRDGDYHGAHLSGTTRLTERFVYATNGDIWMPCPISVAVSVPGHGALLMDVGQLEFSVADGWELNFTPDRTWGWGPDDFEALCAYFE